MDLKSICSADFFHMFVYSLIVTENDIMHVEMPNKPANKNSRNYK